MRCEACPEVNTCVRPDGPIDSDVWLIGEAPGKDENSKNKPFIGKTGRELNEHYLPLSGLRRDKVHITNAIRCLPTTPKGKLDPDSTKHQELLQSCAECFLYPSLREYRPKLIIPMGSFANRAIDPSIDLEMEHGIPRTSKLWPGSTIFGMYHPALGIHSPKSMLYIRTDWARLKKYMTGKLYIPVDDYEGHEDYAEITDPDEVDSELEGAWDYTMGCDTENKRDGSPFCFTFSIYPGRGRLIRAENTACLERVQYHLDLWTGKILWHNWLHDVKIVGLMGLTFKPYLIVDTMQIAYHIGSIPQGLKALSRRLLGAKMIDFDDVVTPHSKRLVLEYYRQMYSLDWPKPEASMERKPNGDWKVYQPHSMKSKLRVFYTYLDKNPDKDVFSVWDNWSDSWDLINEKMGEEFPESGRWPGKCISHAPFESEVIPYACGDSDKLLRLYPILLRARSRMRKQFQEHWLDE
jgi:uracil-DNA glycosylase